MTKLPATFVEADAQVHASEWIAQRREPGGIFHPEAEVTYGRELMKRWALMHPFGADEIVYFAENGSKEADEALSEIIAERIDHNEPLGAVLGAYAIRQRNPRRPRPGPGKAANFVRDLGIVVLMAELVERFNLSPNHNPASSKRPAASTIAAQALTTAGIAVSLGHKGVEKIWQRYLPVFAGSRLALRTRFATGWPTDYPGLFG
jgi:hypothetical protein